MSAYIDGKRKRAREGDEEKFIAGSIIGKKVLVPVVATKTHSSL